MASQALYLRWRPMTFEDVVGQEHVTTTLRNALSSQRTAHAYLFSGPRGTGKTTTARLLAKAVNCLNADVLLRPDNTCAYCQAVNEGRFLDMIEIDAASHTGVDDVRELRDRIAFAPNEGNYKVYIIDEVHRFSGAAFDALLKTIEEPPDHAIFVLATTEIHKVPQTILSRCQHFEFRRIALHQVIERLQLMIEAEGIEANPEALELIARCGTGSLRDSISLLDQLVVGPDDILTLERVQAVLGTVADQAAQSVVDMIIAGNTASGLELINHVMDEGGDARQFADQIVTHLRNVMLAQAGGIGGVETFLSPESLAVVQQHASLLTRRLLLATLEAFNEAATTRHNGWQPQLPLELAFLKCIDIIHSQPEVTSDLATRAAPVQQSVPSPAPQKRAGSALPQAADNDLPSVRSDMAMPTIKDIALHWDEIKRLVKGHDIAAEALLNSGRLHSMDEDALVIQMPSELLRGKLEDGQYREIVEQVLMEYFNLPIKLRCRAAAGPGRATNQVEDLLADDSVASYMVNELGGEVTYIEDGKE